MNRRWFRLLLVVAMLVMAFGSVATAEARGQRPPPPPPPIVQSATLYHTPDYEGFVCADVSTFPQSGMVTVAYSETSGELTVSINLVGAQPKVQYYVYVFACGYQSGFLGYLNTNARGAARGTFTLPPEWASYPLVFDLYTYYYSSPYYEYLTSPIGPLIAPPP
jgi:hypothetical protein